MQILFDSFVSFDNIYSRFEKKFYGFHVYI